MASAMIVGAAIAAAGTVFKGVQGFISGRNTAKSMEKSAAATIQQGKSAADRIRARARRMAGAQRARFGASGVDQSESVVDVQYDSAVQHEIDALTTEYGANVKAANLIGQSRIMKNNATAGLISSGFQAAGTVLGGIGTYNAMTHNPGFFGDISLGNAPTIA